MGYFFGEITKYLIKIIIVPAIYILQFYIVYLLNLSFLITYAYITIIINFFDLDFFEDLAENDED